MGVLYKCKMALQRLMYGRNGSDQLGRAAIVAALVLDVVSMFVIRNRHLQLVGILLYWVAMALLLYAIFRAFSKNLYKRREENSKFLQWTWKVKNGRSAAKARHADTAHKYFTCKNCKTICRVPVGKGKVIITCPKCGAQIHGKT
ncbi:MAG: hypothetical protein V8R40_01240 [Dysosmobacter sp.]|uniref:hypothetical protein n=1 Tax=Dysosmobacter sp. TaxID=2591382 RepID=UPI00260C02C3|nr:hypothetical protein [Dysosmobacter sp.]